MIAQQRFKRHKVIFYTSLVAFAVIVILKLSYAINVDAAIWLAVVLAAASVIAHVGFDLPDPNRNPELNQQSAAQKVAAGTLQHQPGKLLPGARDSALAGRPIVHRIALGVLVASALLTPMPELVRVSQHWPLNAECYPPVLGPGDLTRIYMNNKITSVKGFWRGDAHADLHESASSKPLSVGLNTNDNKWGSSISAKSSEKETSSRPWVEMVLPNDPALAKKPLPCDIDLNVTYPAMSGSSSFTTVSSKMHQHIDLQLASPGAGAAYNHWWWTGTVLAMALILLSGGLLLLSANALRKTAKPARALVS